MTGYLLLSTFSVIRMESCPHMVYRKEIGLFVTQDPTGAGPGFQKGGGHFFFFFFFETIFI